MPDSMPADKNVPLNNSNQSNEEMDSNNVTLIHNGSSALPIFYLNWLK